MWVGAVNKDFCTPDDALIYTQLQCVHPLPLVIGQWGWAWHWNVIIKQYLMYSPVCFSSVSPVVLIEVKKIKSVNEWVNSGLSVVAVADVVSCSSCVYVSSVNIWPFPAAWCTSSLPDRLSPRKNQDWTQHMQVPGLSHDLGFPPTVTQLGRFRL